MLDDRKLEVLRAIVADYVSSREPVGSRALVERHGLKVSPATVRNDMAHLEEEGYITHPHTSAGRVPTDKGYRLFVDRLAVVKPLSPAERRAIETFMAGAMDIDDIVQRTVRLLAQITRQVAIVQYPVMSSATIRHVELVSLSADRALVVMISSAGRVEQRQVELPLDEHQVGLLKERLNAAVVGVTVAVAAERLPRVPAALAPDLRPLATRLVATLLEMLAADSSTRVVVGGVTNLAHAAERDFSSSVGPILEALEEQVVLLKLLGEVDASDDVTVRIGEENAHAGLPTTSVVASGYGDHDDVWATLGIVGPTRMDYPSTMAAVRAVARYLGRYLAEG